MGANFPRARIGANFSRKTQEKTRVLGATLDGYLWTRIWARSEYIFVDRRFYFRAYGMFSFKQHGPRA